MPGRLVSGGTKRKNTAAKALEGPESRDLVLVDQQVLPEVFVRVLEAKRSLLSGEASSAAEAARRAGLSRSAFYKYKDAVFPYDAGRTGYILTVHSVLRDRPGVLSSMLAAFAAQGMKPLDAALCAVYLHGAAADRCAKRKSETAMLPHDIFKDLGKILRDNGR